MNHIPFEEKIEQALALSKQLADTYRELNKLLDDNIDNAILHTEYAQEFELDIAHIVENRKLGAAYSAKAIRLISESRMRRRHSKDFEKLAERLRPNLSTAERAVLAIESNAQEFSRFVESRTYTCRTPDGYEFFKDLPESPNPLTVSVEPCTTAKARRYERLNVIVPEPVVKKEPHPASVAIKEIKQKRKVKVQVNPTPPVVQEAAVTLLEDLPKLDSFDYSEGTFVYIHPAKNYAYWNLVRITDGKQTFSTKISMRHIVDEVYRYKPDFFLSPSDKASRQIYLHIVEVMKSGKTDLYEAYAYVQDMLPLSRVIGDKSGETLMNYAKKNFERLKLS